MTSNVIFSRCILAMMSAPLLLIVLPAISARRTMRRRVNPRLSLFAHTHSTVSVTQFNYSSNLFVCLFLVCMFARSLIDRSFVRAFGRSIVRSSCISLVRSSVRLLFRSFVRSFVLSIVRSCVRALVILFICSFAPSFVRSFI